ncbi:unnamed protein product, partial [Prorocentrum cordatum]
MSADWDRYCPEPVFFLLAGQRARDLHDRRVQGDDGEEAVQRRGARRRYEEVPWRRRKDLGLTGESLSDFCVICSGIPAYCNSGSGLLLPGETCQSEVPQSSCFSGTAPTFTCPSDHTGIGAALPSIFYYEPQFPEVLCQVCGVGSVDEDADERAGYYSGVVSFGRNMKGGVIDESDIQMYKVYFTDSTGTIDYMDDGDASVATIAVTRFNGDKTCCDEMAYQVQLQSAKFTVGFATNIMVVSVDKSGWEMPVGKTIEFTDSAFECLDPVDMLAVQAELSECPAGSPAQRRAAAAAPAAPAALSRRSALPWVTAPVAARPVAAHSAPAAAQRRPPRGAAGSPLLPRQLSAAAKAVPARALNSTACVDQDAAFIEWLSQYFGADAPEGVSDCPSAIIGCYSDDVNETVWDLCCATCSAANLTFCDAHDECGAGTLCGDDGLCHACEECTECGQGIDGTCGMCPEPADGPCEVVNSSGVACKSCPLFEGTNCADVPAGEYCTPTLGQNAVCLSGAFPDFYCPADNADAGRIPVIFTALPDYLCKVCEATLGDDSNSDAGVFTGTLTFGPNQVYGQAYEATIKEYRVYFVDAATGVLASEVLATVGVDSLAPVDSSCCDGGRYQVTISDVSLPNDTASWHLAVVPVEDLGSGEELEMVTGTSVALFDLTPPTSTNTTNTATTASVTTTSTTPMITYVISVSMGLSFDDPEAAVADPQVAEGVELGIAVSSGLGAENKGMVDATLSLARRRLGAAPRRLTGSNVD